MSAHLDGRSTGRDNGSRTSGNALAAGASSTTSAAAFAMDPHLPAVLFDGETEARLRARVDLRLDAPVRDFAQVDPDVLADLDVLITGWGSPVIGSAELERMPRVRAIVHAAGTVKGHVMPEVWDRGIRVTSAAVANAYPVAEYTLGMILLAGKGIAPATRPAVAPGAESHLADIGNYRRIVGIIGASTVGRQVIRLLSLFDFRVLLYDPVIADDDPILSQATRVDLDELLSRSSIVSVHAPLLPETVGMLGPAQLALLAPGSTVINTARAPIIDQDALVRAVLERGIAAILDVTDPEPLPVGHPLLDLPGVRITQHVAGALGNELRRLGEAAVREIELFARGLAAAYPVHKQDLAAKA